MGKPKRVSVALTIAGSDSGGGAGVQADLKTFAALGTHGVCAITCLTAQNPRGVLAVQSASPAVVVKQLEAVFKELPPQAAKTGMLYSARIIRAVAGFFRSSQRPPLVVDPVMVASSRASLLEPSALRALTEELFPIASLITPNLDEAARLLGWRPIQELDAVRLAAWQIHRRWGCPVLVKGGHLAGMRQAVDFYFDGRHESLFQAPYISGVATHGTGCTFSAAITAELAKGRHIETAILRAKEFITGAIAFHQKAAKHDVLNCFWKCR